MLRKKLTYCITLSTYELFLEEAIYTQQKKLSQPFIDVKTEKVFITTKLQQSFHPLFNIFKTIIKFEKQYPVNY